MARSELFLLLPVFEETDKQPDYISRIGIIDIKELNEYIDKILESKEFLTVENYTGYYDVDNIKAFLLPIEIMEDCYPNAMTRFRSAMNKWGENWRNGKKQDNNVVYKLWGKEIQDCILCEITERKCVSTDGSTFLLASCDDALSCKTKTISVERQGKDVEIDTMELELKNITSWFENNRRPSRVFNWNPKHGEYGKGEYPGASKLMGSREEAAELLHKAVGTDLRVLFFFDEKYNQYIEFKRESENTYHAFHLDKEDEKRVPAKIKQHIDMLR